MSSKGKGSMDLAKGVRVERGELGGKEEEEGVW